MYVLPMKAENLPAHLLPGSVDLLLTDPPYFGIVGDAWDNQWPNPDAYAQWLADTLLAFRPTLAPDASVLIFQAMGKHGCHPVFDVVRKLERGGLHFRNWITWKKRRAYGKQIALTTEIPTPDGFVQLRDIRVGDTLFDERGERCHVTKLHPIDLAPESYRVTFDDGTTVDACKDHLWWTQTKQERRTQGAPRIRTTESIYCTLRRGKESNHSIPTCEPVAYRSQMLPIDPYLLGVWLGDGSSDTGAVTTADPEVLDGVEHHEIPSGALKGSKARLYRCHGLTTQLRELGVLRNKHIPELYLRGDRQQRLSLLQGLMDTDGSCSAVGQVEFCNMNEVLACQVKELMLSLGMKATLTQGPATLGGVVMGTKFRVGCVTSAPVFRLPRKLIRVTANGSKPQRGKRSNRYIVDVLPIPPVAMRCLTVDSPNGLFLITRNFIPTHNSHDYLYIREEILWFSVSSERTQVRFNIPLSNELRGYAGFSADHPAKSEYKRIGNAFSEHFPTMIDDCPELMRPERSCQKPNALMRRLVETHSHPGDFVVDPFAGWGSTGVAALELGRSFLGSEAIAADATAANARCVAVRPVSSPAV